jgi:hypothetical protein
MINEKEYKKAQDIVKKYENEQLNIPIVRVRSGVCGKCKNENIDKTDWCFENCIGGSEFKPHAP